MAKQSLETECIHVLDPSYAYPSGHHQDLNQSLIKVFSERSIRTFIWCDKKISDNNEANGIFEDVGYFAEPEWWTLPVTIQLAHKIKEQLLRADGLSEKKPKTWLGHSLLPFQILGLAFYLSEQPKSNIHISLMFSPGETFDQLEANNHRRAECTASYTWLELSRICKRNKHQLHIGSASSQTTKQYKYILEKAKTRQPELQPAFCGSGWKMREEKATNAYTHIMLHWGDLKPDKGVQEALFMIRSLLDGWRPIHPCRFLFQSFSHRELENQDRRLLVQAKEELGELLVWIEDYQTNEDMMDQLSQCDVALLAYDSITYANRSSGILWCYAAARFAIGKPATAIGYGDNWLAAEARELGMEWIEMKNICDLLDKIDVAVKEQVHLRQHWTAYAQSILENSYADHLSKALAN
jgi:hypothetical protein